MRGINLYHDLRMAAYTIWCTAAASLLFRVAGIGVGRGLVSAGMPIIRRYRGARVVVGRRLHLVNCTSANLIGVNHPCTLGAYSGATVIIGDDCGFSGTTISARKEIIIGNHVLVGANTIIADHDFHPLDHLRRRDPSDFGAIKTAPVRIEDDVFVGANVTILKGVTIGARSVIGAGSIVTRSVPEGTIWAGNPARMVGTFADERD